MAAIGRLKRGATQDLAEHYRVRAGQVGRSLGISGVRVVEMPEARGGSVDERRTDEAERLLHATDGASLRLALDERGRTIDSLAFANLLDEARGAGQGPCAIMIGGPDGQGDAIVGARDRASKSGHPRNGSQVNGLPAGQVLSFGAMTLPHGLVRVVLLEQIYRGLTILAGHPYHRE